MALKDSAKRKEYLRKWHEAHPGKKAEYARNSVVRHGENHKDYQRKYQRKYRWRVMNMPQPTRPEPEWCECCGRISEKTLHLDHDHKTGSFRGWICGPCNHALGLLGDDRDGVLKALAYLARAQ